MLFRSQTFTVNSVEGERAEIVVTPSDGVDVAIEVSNDSSTVDERITGGVETFSFLADSATIRVTVTSASGAGSFSIKLTPGNGL